MQLLTSARSLGDIVRRIPAPLVSGGKLEAPLYTSYDWPEDAFPNLMLAVESMKYHMTNEGWEIAEALQHSGYKLAGFELPIDETDVSKIVHDREWGTIVVQDKREWDVRPGDFREPAARFVTVGCLREHDSIFKLTILKDAHQCPLYHKESAEEIGCHAWIIYYHPTIVQHVAPYVRPEHLIRTYHSLNKDSVPQYSPKNRRGSIISGALNRRYYPLRKAIVESIRQLPDCHHLPHPGYHRNGCATPLFLRTLSRYKVAICTSSIYGYALRKIIEATACGCRVITDLPVDEVLPGIDDNLVRVPPYLTYQMLHEFCDMLNLMYNTYDAEKQEYFSNIAKEYYDYHAIGLRLASDIENTRRNYNG